MSRIFFKKIAFKKIKKERSKVNLLLPLLHYQALKGRASSKLRHRHVEAKIGYSLTTKP
jgi:hypothetical protein